MRKLFFLLLILIVFGVSAQVNRPTTSGSGTVTSVAATVPTGLSVSGSPITESGTLGFGYATGYSIPTDANQSNWIVGYNDKVNSLEFTGTTTKTLTLTQQDAGTVSNTFTDIGFANPLTTQGDIIVQGAGGTTRLAVGTNGQVLTTDGTDVSWGAGGGTSYWSQTGNYIYPATIGDNVGIGTTSPTQELDVTGDFKVSDTTWLGTALYGDGATWYTDPHNTDNVMLGEGAGAINATHGSDNIGIGQNALKNITNTSDHNIAIGTDAGKNLSGDKNILIGSFTGDALTTSGVNVMIGYNVGSAATNTANNNVLIGEGNMAVGNSSSNTMIGVKAGNGGAGGNNTCLGYYAGANTSGSNGVFLGYYAGADETGSNTIIIDNLDRTSEALGRSSAPFYAVTNATPANQIVQIGGGGKVTITDILNVKPIASAPGSPVEGDVYMNSTDHHLYLYNGTGWVQLDN